jgi:hypothetical protein
MERNDGRAFWKDAIAIGFIGGILSGAIGTVLSSAVGWVLPGATLYDSPNLLVRSLTLLCVGFWARMIVQDSWVLAGLVMGVVAVLVIWLFPINAHALPTFHWSALTVLPAGLAGMALKEVMEG